ncbi:MAG: sigma-E processing peptidase SpoIIGA [Candidatus Coproplasma sp.]
MQVYIEYALAENFCMDFILLLSAKWATKNTASYWRVALSSALGACFAVVFPLFSLNAGLGVIIKIAFGFLMCAIGGKYSTFKGYLKFSLTFTAITFLTGGLLIALFSLANLSYEQGGGYLISSVPIGIPIFAVTVIEIVIKKLCSKIALRRSVEAVCKITCGKNSVVCKGFYDSGNKVFLNGSPVTVIPSYVAQMLTDVKSIKTFAKIHTVAGDSDIPIFTAEKIEIDDGERLLKLSGVLLGVSPQRINKIVLHPDLSEAS